MSQALQIRRGLKSALPAKAALGEPLIAIDTRELFVGVGTGVGDGDVYKIGDVIFADTPPDVTPEKIWIDTANEKIYRAADDGLSWTAIGGAGSGAVSADFMVYGVTQGVYTDGQVITAGTSLETIVKNMLQAVIPPTYVSPTLGLTGSGQLNVEAGTILTPLLTPAFNQQDGGAPIQYVLRKDGLALVTNPTAQAFSDAEFQLGDTAVSYQATNSYDAGPVKNNNQGNPSPTGQIAAGATVSNTVTYTGKRFLFYTADIGNNKPVTSDDVRFLPSKVLGPTNGAIFTLNIPAGTKRVVFAYPESIRDVTSVKYVELGNGEVKDTFIKTVVNVEGNNAFAPVGYKIYSYVPAVPFGDAVTYVVTI